MPGNDSNVVSLLPMGGATGVTAFSDNANGGTHVWTAHGNSRIGNGTYKFGSSSGYFPGATGDYIGTPYSVDWYFGTGDFTIDFWLNFVALPASGLYMMVCSLMIDVNHVLYIAIKNNAGTYQADFYTTIGTGTSTIRSLQNLSSLTTGQWNHFAIVRTGTKFRWFMNGIQQGADVTDANSTANLSTPPTEIGRWNYSSAYYCLNGYLSVVRTSKGIARWTATFSPPTQAYNAMVMDIGATYKNVQDNQLIIGGVLKNINLMQVVAGGVWKDLV